MTIPATTYLAIDAGGTYLKSAVLNALGEIIRDSYRSAQSFSEGSKSEIFGAFSEVISEGNKSISERNLKLGGIGIAFPGPFDIYNARPLMKHKFQAIHGLDLRAFFYENQKIKNHIPINFVHDANAVLQGEIWKGNAKGFNNVAVITIGTGLGFSVSQDGELLSNEIGGPNVSIFKLPCRNGILEDYISQRGFLNIYGEFSGKNTTDIQVSDLGKWADKGDDYSLKTFQEVAKILSDSLRNIIIERNIECVLFGGQISRSFHHLEKTILNEWKDIGQLKKIGVVKSIDNAALYGAFLNITKNQTNSTH